MCMSYASLHLTDQMFALTIELIIRMDGQSNQSIYGH